MTFENEVKPVADKLGITTEQIKEMRTELERIRVAGINGSKAGRALRKLLDKLKHD